MLLLASFFNPFEKCKEPNVHHSAFLEVKSNPSFPYFPCRIVPFQCVCNDLHSDELNRVFNVRYKKKPKYIFKSYAWCVYGEVESKTRSKSARKNPNQREKLFNALYFVSINNVCRM